MRPRALIYAGVVFAVSRLRNSVTWLQVGKIDRKLLLVILATAIVSGVALTVWFHLAPLDPGRYAGRIPEMPLGLLALAGLGFAALNAAMEEAAFRGIVMTALEHTLGAGVAAVCVQAFLFGAAHYLSGFPNGAWGVAMTSVYGLVLGVLRRMSGGLLAPWLAHTLADGVVFALVAGVAAT